MFILPTFDNLKIRQVPWATILLIIICFWVFFVMQHGDEKKLDNLILEYGENGLLKTEAEAYTRFQYTKQEGNRIWLPSLDGFETKGDEKSKLEYYGEIWLIMQRDVAFQNALRSNLLIPQDFSEDDDWYYLRKQYDEDIKSVVWFSYSFKTAWPSMTTTFTHMFLHADIYHLLGNMIFLFVAGTVLEAVVGGVPFLLVYLFTGMVDTWLNIPFSRDPTVAYLGASGAISGVMGTYSIIMGLKRVPVFVSLGFFFTNLKLPAILLIVVWAIKEAAYFFLYPNSRVSYMAHFCGYLVGGVAGVPLRLWRGKRAEILFDHSEETKKQDIGEAVSKGVEHLKNLEFTEARICIVQALEQKPGDVMLLQHLFAIDSQLGDIEKLRITVENLLQQLLHARGQEHILLRIHRQYLEKAGLRLSDELLFSLVARFAKLGHFDDMMTIILHLGKKNTTDERFAPVLLLAVRQLLNSGEKKRAIMSATLLVQLFPDHHETRVARSLFSSSQRKEKRSEVN